jgi:transcriptional regulator with XRE-family HTH domain
MTTADRIREARQVRNLSQGSLARLAGIWSTQVSKWENGVYPVSIDNLERLSKALGVSMDWLLSGTGKGPRPVVVAPRDTPIATKMGAKKNDKGKARDAHR